MEKLLFQIAQKMLVHIGEQCCHFLMLLYRVLLDLAQSCLQNHCKLYCISSRSMHLVLLILSGLFDADYHVLFSPPSQFLSRSNMLRLTMSSRYEFHSLFTYSIVLLFLCTAGFWVWLTLMHCSWGLSLLYMLFLYALISNSTPLWDRWQDWMKGCHYLMQYWLFQCFKLHGPSSLFVQDLFTFKNIKWVPVRDINVNLVLLN